MGNNLPFESPGLLLNLTITLVRYFGKSGVSSPVFYHSFNSVLKISTMVSFLVKYPTGKCFFDWPVRQVFPSALRQEHVRSCT